MNEHSRMYDKIKKWYDAGLWDYDKVYQAVPKLITQEEADEITQANESEAQNV